MYCNIRQPLNKRLLTMDSLIYRYDQVNMFAWAKTHTEHATVV